MIEPAQLHAPLPGDGEDQVRGGPLGMNHCDFQKWFAIRGPTHVVCQARENTPFVSWDRPLSLYVKGATAGIALEPFFL